MPKFTRKIEDFICENCGAKVAGNGYTNHCPRCLYSRHVDINPGDRQNPCQGLMKPIRVEMERGEYILVHQCEKCGSLKRNKSGPQDNFDNILKLSAQI